MTTTNQKIQMKEVVIRVLMIALSSLIAAVNFKTFVSAGDLFPGGFTGVTRLIQRCAIEFYGVELPFAPINLALNSVPAFISFKLVGKRFTLYSCLTIVLTSIFTDLVPALDRHAMSYSSEIKGCSVCWVTCSSQLLFLIATDMSS